ncbi:MAG: hypothetical protein J7483_07160 [Novosphingobium sp.]|nr:hypothetical protein [Novosphingobium sp.]
MATSDRGEAPGEPTADLLWTDELCASVPPQDHTVMRVPESDGVWTRHFFGGPGLTSCAFAVSPDGRHVHSRRDPQVRPEDLLGLFAEPVMRTVLTRQAIPSFHGAALARDGRCILLLGDSGAGKSTIAGALMRDGWVLLTDDLARVSERHGAWFVAPGFRQLKLHSKTVRHLSLDPASVRARWTSYLDYEEAIRRGSGLEHGSVPKYALPDERDAEETRLGAIYLLGKRRPGPARAEPLSPIEQIRGALNHLTLDPAAPAAPPPAAFARIIPAILRQAPCLRLAMPDAAPEAIAAVSDFPWLQAADERTSVCA